MTKTIFVTGATAGFGEAIARRFAADGWDIIASGRRQDRLDKLKEELERAHQVRVATLAFDVRDKAAVAIAIGGLMQSNIAVDVLVNNAGLASGFSSVQEGDTDDWDLMIDTNVKGLLYVTRQVAPAMIARGCGHIFNIGSTAGKVVYKNGNVYCATKFAVDALTQSMRIDMLTHGIKVTAINPGMAETEFSIVRFKGDTERAGKVYENFPPLQAVDIADVVHYCASLPAHVCINDLTITPAAQANSVYNIKTV